MQLPLGSFAEPLERGVRAVIGSLQALGSPTHEDSSSYRVKYMKIYYIVHYVIVLAENILK